MRNENVFREARLIAMHCISSHHAANLRKAADDCKEVFDRFNISCSREDFRELVGLWTKLLLVMDLTAPYVEPPTPQGGRVRLTAHA